VAYSVNGTILNNDDAVYPCGAIAKFIFDDIVSIPMNGETVNIDQEDIDYDFDDVKFTNIGDGWEAKQTLNMSDPWVRVWY